MRAAKERKRLAQGDPEPPPLPPDPRPLWIMTIQGRNAVHRVIAFPSPRRRNALRVTIDGQLWKPAIGLSRVLAALRKKLPFV